MKYTMRDSRCPDENDNGKCSHNVVKKWLKDAAPESFPELFRGLENTLCFKKTINEPKIYKFTDFEGEHFLCTLCYIKKKSKESDESFEDVQNLHIIGVKSDVGDDNVGFNPNCFACERTLFDIENAMNCWYCRMEYAAHHHLLKKYEAITVIEDWIDREDDSELWGHENEEEEEEDSGINLID